MAKKRLIITRNDEFVTITMPRKVSSALMAVLGDSVGDLIGNTLPSDIGLTRHEFKLGEEAYEELVAEL